MAKLERTLSQDFDRLLHQIEQKLLQGSFTATLEDSSDFYGEGARCSVRVFERYSYFGGNRLSLNLTLFQAGNGPVQLSAHHPPAAARLSFLRSIPSEKKPFWINWKKFYKMHNLKPDLCKNAKVRFFCFKRILYQ